MNLCAVVDWRCGCASVWTSAAEDEVVTVVPSCDHSAVEGYEACTRVDGAAVVS